MATLERTFAPCPTTERGRASRLHGCAAGVARVAYGAGKVAVVRELADPTRCVVFMEHAHRVSCAALSPNGEWVASGDASGLVRVWPANLQEGQNEPTTKVEIRALAGPVEDIAWSGDGDRIAVAGASRGACVKAFTWNSGSAIGEMAGHSKGVLAVAFRPERPFKIATAGEDFYTNFYEGPPFKQAKASSNVHGNFVNAVTFSPDGALYATAGSDKRVFVWDGLTGEKKAEIAAHAGSIYALDWSADSKAFLTASADKTAKLWDAGSGECSTTFSFSDKPTLQDMQVGCAMVGDTMVTASLSGDLNFLDKANPSAPARVVKGHTRAVTALARGASADEFYSGGSDGTILKWSTERGCVGPGGAPHSNPVVGMALDVGSGVLYSAAMDDTVRAGGESSPTEGQPKSHSLAQESANGTAVVVTTSGVCVYVGAKLLSTLGNDALGFEATTAAVSPDASQVAIGAPGGKIHMYELKGDTLTAAGGPMEKHTMDITVLAFSPDGAILGSGDAKREVVMWDAASREVKQSRMVYHTARISAMSWSPDSTKLATGSLDMSVIVWPVGVLPTKRKTIARAHHGGVQSVAFLDDATIVSGGADRCARMWRLSEA